MILNESCGWQMIFRTQSCPHKKGSFVLFVNYTEIICTILRDVVVYDISYSIKLTPSSMISIVLVAPIAINIYYLQVRRLRRGFHRILNQELLNRSYSSMISIVLFTWCLYVTHTIRGGFHRILILLVELLNKLWYIYTSLCCAQTHKCCRMVDIPLKADIIPPLAA